MSNFCVVHCNDFLVYIYILHFKRLSINKPMNYFNHMLLIIELIVTNYDGSHKSDPRAIARMSTLLCTPTLEIYNSLLL